MLLFELFDDDVESPKSGDMTNRLRQAALDYLTPLMAQNVPFIMIDQMIEALRTQQFGIVVNRAMIMDLLDPEQVEAVAKIEGDKIFLEKPDGSSREVDADDAQKDQDHVADMAQTQAKKSVAQSNLKT